LGLLGIERRFLAAIFRRSSVLWLLLLAACDKGPGEMPIPVDAGSASEPVSTRPSAAPLRAQRPLEPAELEYELGKKLLIQVSQNAAAPGAPGFDRVRAQLVGRAKGEPVVLVRTPQFNAEVGREAAYYRTRFASEWKIWPRLVSARQVFVDSPKLGRESILREGYLYAEHPNQAFSLVSLVGLDWLFSEKEVWLERGEVLMHAERRERGDYYFTDGPLAGSLVRLMHLDRMGVGAGPTEAALHRDFRALKYRLHFEQARIEHLGETQIVASLRYGPKLWIPTLLTAKGAHLELLREVVAPTQVAELREHRARQAIRQNGMSALREAMLALVREGMPFDEPKTEVGQEDGKLRAEWVKAYLAGRNSYTYREDRYPVFDKVGRPLVPEVCVDFLLDTFERAAGSWWRQKAEGSRELTRGSLDLGSSERSWLRRASSLIEFALAHPEWFEVWEVPEGERIELGYKEKFFNYLEKNAGKYEAGDIILIRGLTPWDEEEMHTHAFFIYETDPITGIPILIAGNAWRPQVWSWEAEARRTPKRTVRTRIRPKLEFLQLLAGARTFPQEPPPIAPIMEW